MADPNVPDLTGSTIGEYEIVSRLGVGGMGIVYEGRQPLIGKRVAVKVLLPQLSSDSDLVERFVAEARAVNEIGHRGIVDIFSFGTLPTGQAYFVMEYLNGLPFDRLVKTRAPIPPEEVLWWAEEICEALQGAHEAGIIHRDIKPSNLFLVDSGRGRPYVKLLDFGIAKLGAKEGESAPQTRASMVVGTPDYMSPEQARGKPVSPATDVYALGCVMFELLTGKRAFKGENALETMFMHVENPPPKLSDFVPGQPAELEELLLWTMEKSPTERPMTADELRVEIAALRKVLPEVVLTPRPSPSRHDVPSLSPSGRQLPIATPRPSGPRRSIGSGSHPKAATPIPAPVTRALPPVESAAIPVELNFTAELPRVNAVNSTEVAAPGDPESTGEPSAAAKPPEIGRGTGEPSAAKKPVIYEDDDDLDENGFPRRNNTKRNLAIGGIVLLLAAGAFALRKSPKPKEAEPPVAAKIEPPPMPAPEPRPAKISAEALSKRIAKFDAQLKEKETRVGDADDLMRQLSLKAKADLAKATTEPKRRDLWDYLDEIQAQLDKR